MTRHIAIPFLILISLCLSAKGQEISLYLSPKGQGDKFTVNSPGHIATLTKKLQALQSSNPRYKVIKIFFSGGTYIINKTVDLTRREIGDASLRVASIGKGRPLLCGGSKIIGWSYFRDGIYKARIPDSLDARQLYVNGEMAIRARYPNLKNINDLGPYLRISSFDGFNKKLYIKKKDAQYLKNQDNMEIVINQHWFQNRLLITSKKDITTESEITLKGPQGDIFFNTKGHGAQEPGKCYYLENSLDLLDVENEWYLDRQNNLIYYKPRNGVNITKLDIIIPRLETLVKITGMQNAPIKNPQIKNIDFAYSTWTLPSESGLIINLGVSAKRHTKSFITPGLLELNYVNVAQINQCKFYNSGANGIVLGRGVNNTLIDRNKIFDICANGIVIDNYNKPNPPKTIQCVNNTISNNFIKNIGLNYTNGMGIIASCVADHIIENNEISYVRYTGIEIGNNHGDILTGTQNNTVRRNNIHHVMLLHDDGAAIYTLSNQPGTKIYENYIHDIIKSQWADNYPINGIYLDNNSAFIEVQNNVFERLVNVIPLKENLGTKKYTKTKSHNNKFIAPSKTESSVKSLSGIKN